MDTNIRSLVEILNKTCRHALEQAAQICVRQTHYAVDIEHYLLALLETPATDVDVLLGTFGVTTADVKRDVLFSLGKLKTGNTKSPSISNNVVEMLSEARKISLSDSGEESIRSGYILMALYQLEPLRKILIEVSANLAFISKAMLKAELKSAIESSREDKEGEPQSAAPGQAEDSQPAPSRASGKALGAYTQDLTAQARSGALDPIFGRDAEIRQVIDILTRRRQNNPILTGEPGVGKTAVVEGLAQKIVKGDVPPMLKDVTLRVLDMGLLQAGAGMKGEFENRLKSVIQEVKQSPNPIILFIDEAHSLIGAGGASGQGDAANLLKPALARGELRTIAATTWAEYKSYFEKDPALTRRFQVVKVEEPKIDSAIDMLRGITAKFEYHHKVRILDEAVKQAVKLSHRFLPERKLPDKAMSVLDTASARVAITQASQPSSLEAVLSQRDYLERELSTLTRENVTTPIHAERIEAIREAITRCNEEVVVLEERWKKEKELVDKISSKQIEVERLSSENSEDTPAQLADLSAMRADLESLHKGDPLVLPFVDGYGIATIISNWTGIPIGKMLTDNVDAVYSLEESLGARVKGQPQAIEAIAKRMRTSIAGLSDPNKPTAVFLLVGPSGVGKTETGLALADTFFGGEHNLTTIAMSEYQEAHTVSLLKGAPPGYVGYGKGGVLTEAVRRNPYSVVLLDEVEKAHLDVLELFYQVFDKGILEDSEGLEVSFKNTVLILTSNLGTDTLMKLCMGGETLPEPEQLIEAIRPELQAFFKPALLGRMVVVPFYPLGLDELAEIVRLKVKKSQRQFRERYNANLIVTDELVKEIADRCTDPDSGARNIDNILTNTILPELSLQLLEKIAAKQVIGDVTITVDENGNFVYSI